MTNPVINPLVHIPRGPAPSSQYPSIGFDPAPGNADTVGLLATELRTVADKIHNAQESLMRVGHSDGIWRGEAADAFRGEVGELPKYLDDAGTGLQQAAVALGEWGDDLESLQKTAQILEDEAQVARHQLARAESDPGLDEAGRTYTDDAQLAAAQARLDAATDALRRARQQLEDIIDRAERLLRQHQELADLTARALDKACSEAPEEGFFESLGNALDSLADGIADLAAEIWQFIEDNADLINEISNVMSTLSTVVGTAALLFAWAPGVNLALGGIALSLSAAALAGHSLAKAAGADVTWTTIAMDGFGVVTGAAGTALGAVGKGATAMADELASVAPEVAAGYNATASTLGKAGTWYGAGASSVGIGVPYAVDGTGIETTSVFHEDFEKYLVPKGIG